MLSSVIFTNLACSHVRKKCLTKKLFAEKAIILQKPSARKRRKHSERVRLTTCSLIGQIYFIHGFLLASENDIFTRKKYRIFYMCLNTIFLSGQKLYITLMFIR